MSWFRVDDGMLDHPKWKRAIRDGGDAALHLWLSLGTWCSRHLTDGKVPADMLSEIPGPKGKRTRERAMRALESEKLLVKHIDGSVLVHDYLDYNPSRADVLAERSRWASCKRKQRDTEPVHGGHSRDSRVSPDVPSRPVPIIPSQQERETRALEVSPPTVPGLAIVHPGPLPQSKRERAECDAMTDKGNPRYEYTEGWTPNKANQARGHELGLTDEEIWARWETCKDKHYTSPFRSDVKQFNRELAFAAQDKTTVRFKSKQERDAFEMPGRERRGA